MRRHRGGDGGASSVLAVAAIAVVAIVALLTVDVALLVAHRIRVANAADAAALAAAPVTFRSFGSTAGPVEEARRFAEANGARLVACICRIDGSLASRTVRVVAASQVELVMFGRQTVTAAGAATFSPARAISRRAPP